MRTITCQLLGSLLLLLLVTSCSRPVAYFQPSAHEQIVPVSSQTATINVTPVQLDQNPAQEISPAQQVAQAKMTFDEVDALVSNDRKLAGNKTGQKRLSRVRMLLASAATRATLAPTETIALKKATFVERLMLKKMNRKISRQLAPTNPEKTLASKSILVLGAILVLGGILLVALTTGGGFALGAIALATGLVILLIELL
ncbi:hypothetical protein GO755_01785 [Spirosoma sp. HMF4905]|uniref:Uncharacterized protein n=1 Tax=Spirosoma arboris TaxID=2682092 RepID=A0A7K1S538_9BACT|nr:hypothetical protein [Spirosoma arboris]MVM28746.1 hypothetical protein [Spirosoma arboris]